jgi:hypothetical protein
MRKILAVVFVSLPLLSIAQKELVYVRENVKINRLLVLPPVSISYAVNSGSKLQMDEEASKKMFSYTSALLQKGFPDSVKTSFFSADSVLQSRLHKFLSTIHKDVNNERRAKKFQLPDSILNLFDNTEAEFVFCTYNIGFKRSRNNLVNTQQTMELLDMLTGFGIRPLESSLLMSCFVLDLKQKNLLYIERDIRPNIDPSDHNVIKLQLTRMIAHFLI